MEDLIKKYYEKENIKYYLPLIESLTKIDNKGRKKLDGAMSNFKKIDYEKLSRGEKIMVKWKNGKKYEYKFKTSYEEAKYYELNMNAIDECIIIIDIDEDIKEEDKKKWLKMNIPEIIRGCPYTLSRTKKMPHYYCILEGVSKEILIKNIKTITECLTFCKGDILASHVWEEKNSELKNYNGELPKIHINDLKKYILKKSFEKFNIEDINDDETITIEKIKELEEQTIKSNNTLNIYENKEIDELSEISEITNSIINEEKKNNINIKELKKYLNGLKDKRSDNYDEWKIIIWGIANICRDNKWSSKIRNELIHEFSKKSEKYDVYRVDDFIDNHIKDVCDGIGIGTIIKFYNEDNEFYKNNEIKKITLECILRNRLRDNDIALYIKQILGENYVCSDINRNIWYIFENHRWNEDHNGITLFKKISNKVPEEAYKKYNYYENKIKEIRISLEIIDEEKEIMINDIKKNLNELNNFIDKCKNRTSKTNIFKELKDEYYKKDFVDRLDINPYIICCNNGIIDIKNNIFRDGEPNDMCSMTIGYNYISLKNIKEDEKLNNKYVELIEFMEKLFVIKGIRDYMYEHLASVLIGDSKEQDFNYYMGKGSNGKTMLVNLMEKLLGDYYGVAPTALICSKKTNIGTCTGEIALLRGKRYVVMQEPTKGEIMNEGTMKEYTGQTPVLCNPKNKTPFYFTPMFKLVICANFTLNITSNDDGTWRRIKVIDFLSKFKYNSDENELFEFEKDIDLKDKFDEWKSIFLAILTEKAFELKGKINENEYIMNATLRYRDEQNRIGIYINKNLEFDKDNNLDINLLDENLKNWFESNYRSKIGLKYLLDILEDKYDIRISNSIIYGIKLKENNELIKSDDEIFIEEFKKSFEIIEDENERDKYYVKSIKISEWARLKNLKIYTSKSINKILLEKLNYDSNNKSLYKYKKIDNKSILCWIGLREI